MELLRVKEIQKVYSVLDIEGKLVVSSTSKNLNYYNQTLDLEYKLEDKVRILHSFKFNSSTYIISTRNELIRQEDKSISHFLENYKFTDSLKIKNHIVLYKGKIWDRKFCVYSFPKNQILWELENTSITVISDYCFSRKKTNFKVRDIETGDILWEKTITDDFEEAKSYKFLTVYNKVLVVAVNDTILAGYNADTGEFLWSVKETNNQNLVEAKDGKLKGISLTSYFETEIETGVYRRIEFAPYEAFNEPGFFSSERDNFTIVNNHIITTDFFSNRIGAFNLETLQYDWFYTEETATGFPASRPIKYFAPYLCLIDNADTLHIYKVDNLIA